MQRCLELKSMKWNSLQRQNLPSMIKGKLAGQRSLNDPAHELLRNAGVFNVVLRRDEVRELVLSSPLPDEVYESYDLRMAGPWELIRDAFACLADPANRIVRVIGNPVQSGGQVRSDQWRVVVVRRLPEIQGEA